MATKKTGTKKPAKRKKPSHSSPAKKTGKKRGKRRKPKTGLSEMVSHQGIKKAAKSSGAGFIGGFGFGVADTFVDQLTDEGAGRELLAFGSAALLSLVAGAALDAPNVAAGIGGAYGYRIEQKISQAVLSEMEDEEYADEDSLEEYPDALDENGTPMYLADDGGFYYLEEFELSEDGQRYDLAESFQADDMYPQYVNSSRF